MKTYDLRDTQERLYAFEIPNVGRSKLCEIVAGFPETTIQRRPCLLSEFCEEEFCEFTFSGQAFRAWEPFGDNSRYWIGPEPVEFCKQTISLQKLFSERPDPTFFGRVVSLFSCIPTRATTPH